MDSALIIDIHAKRFRSPNKLKVHGRGSYILAGFATMIVKLRSKTNLSCYCKCVGLKTTVKQD